MSEYELQEPTFQLSSIGELTVTLPDDDFALFGFRANINKEIEGPETCTIHEESNEMSENDEKKWTVCIRNTDLRREDTVYYWIHVMRHGVEYHKTGCWIVPTDFRPQPIICELLSERVIETIYKVNVTNIKAAKSSSPIEEAKVEETE